MAGISGRQGEDIAAQALASAGYQVLARNWRGVRGEVDIIAQDGDVLVFVEVKARQGRGFGSPAEAVTSAKRSRLLAAAQEYLGTHDLPDSHWRIDVVAVEMGRSGRVLRLDHHVDAVTEDA